MVAPELCHPEEAEYQVFDERFFQLIHIFCFCTSVRIIIIIKIICILDENLSRLK